MLLLLLLLLCVQATLAARLHVDALASEQQPRIPSQASVFPIFQGHGFLQR
jgi:hypothetical protein